MDRGLVGGEDSFDVVQSVSDQSVQGSQAGKGCHGWAHEKGGEEKSELESILSYIPTTARPEKPGGEIH